ncbi:MAG: winged helix-turn-helix transcriptional regulator [Lachnospiraceae bacterium]|nr:winged helix-turn-helix transcriptional regulator [Lachnospiraceae bacterium]
MAGMTSEGMRRFNHLVSETDAVYHEAALRMGMSDSTMQILYILCDKGGHCPLREILALSGVSKQTINSALRKLEEEGTVYLEGMDGKKKRVCLTEKGRELAERTVVKLIEIENGILDSWPRAHVEQYLELTQKYLTALREKTKML